MTSAIKSRCLLTPLVALLAGVVAACGTSPGVGSRTLQVVAGENFWGSIATQIGGSHASVTSIVTDPNADPHSYESSAADARLFATADYVILNGAGYDDWGKKLLDANPRQGRLVLVVADFVKKKAGDNPHFWYNPAWVTQMADRITADLKNLDGGDAGYFSQQRDSFRQALTPYTDAINAIKASYGGAPIGSTESIFVYMADALGLNLISPPEFMTAISEGNDPPASTVAEFHDQLAGKKVKVLVYNLQTTGPVTDDLKKLATANAIPVVGISETIEPTNRSFQDWQVAQLTALQTALRATH